MLLNKLFTQDRVLPATVLEGRLYRSDVPQDDRTYPALVWVVGTGAPVEGYTTWTDYPVSVVLTAEGHDTTSLIEAGDRVDFLVRTLRGEVDGIEYECLRRDAEINESPQAQGVYFSHVGGQYTVRAVEPEFGLLATTP